MMVIASIGRSASRRMRRSGLHHQLQRVNADSLQHAISRHNFLVGESPTISAEEIDEIVSRLRHVTKFERSISRNRLIAYSNGKLPQWGRQVSLTGFESMGYVLIAYVVGTFGGVLMICAVAVQFARGLSDSLLSADVALYFLGFAFIGLTLVRWSQGLSAGKRFKKGSGPPT